MPRMDGTGPMGLGAETGRRRGTCVNRTGTDFGAGRGCWFGAGRGRGCGFGQRQGRGRGACCTLLRKEKEQ